MRHDKYLFKAKRVNGNGWIQGSLYEKDIIGRDPEYYIQDYEVIPETICQCLGWVDKKSYLIFNHDIIMFEYNGKEVKGVVKFSKDLIYEVEFEVDGKPEFILFTDLCKLNEKGEKMYHSKTIDAEIICNALVDKYAKNEFDNMEVGYTC